MLPSQQFCVKWNSYSTNLQSVFPRLLNSEHFVDITLACEGQMIKCHKVVLSACSTYFEKLLVQNPCQHPIIFMKDMKHWEVQALVDFMYKGEVNVNQEELNSLLVAAEALQIRGLCGSENANRQQEGLRQPSSPSSKVSNVSLPNDIVLSGSSATGQESPTLKKRKTSDDKDQSMSGVPRIVGVSSTGGNKTNTDLNSGLSSQVTGEQLRPDAAGDEYDDEMKDKLIKQEIDMEDHFLEGEGDIDVQDDDGMPEPQEDSDSNNRDDVHSNTLLDQPGPSGLTANPAEKAATELNAAFALQNVMCVLAPSQAGKIPIMPLPNTAEVKDYVPLSSPGSTPGSTRVRRSEAELRKAAECVQKGMTFQNVSDAFNIPISTIRFYMARRGILPQRRRGRISNSAQNPAASQSQQQPPYMVLHYKLPDIQKKTS